MSTSNITIVPRVNFFDGQKLSEADLDQEQIHLRGLASDHIMSAHGSGLIKENPLEERALFTLSNPGFYSENASKFVINAGNFDGKPIFLDRQPSDTTFGKRLIFELKNAIIKNNYPVKIVILGSRYNPLDSRGEIVVEYLEFNESLKKVTSNYYKNIYAIYFNNLSGGLGNSFYNNSAESYNYLSSQQLDLVIYESDSIEIFPKSLTVSQVESPNYYLNNFFTYSEEKSLLDIFNEALDETFSSSEIYYETDPSEILLFSQGESSAVSYGQKFLAKTNGLQKISLLMGLDTSISSEFSGSLVISIHKLTTATNCITDAVPDNLINFDPEATSLVEATYSYDDFLAMGVKLGESPTIVDFDFSSTLIANPNLEPSLEIDSYYCFIVKRVGDTSTGTIRLYQGYEKSYQKTQNGQALTIQEQYEPKTTLFTEFDIINNKYVDDSDRGLWFELHSSTVELTSGKAFSEDGVQFEVPSYIEYIGNNLIPFNLKDIELKNINGEKNYIVLDRSEKFTTPIAHPRTGNYTFTRILDTYSIAIFSESELNSILDLNPNILGYVTDNNDRSPSDISGTFSQVGQITPDKIYFINPPSSLLTKALVNRIFIPDTGCSCGSQYKISSVSCSVQRAADINSDGKITYQDLDSVLSLAGNTLTSLVTQNLILNGTISLEDFYKADVDNDGAIDGSDISIIEDAIDGYINFSIPEQFTILEIGLSNINSENNYPIIFQDEAGSGSCPTSSNVISFSITSEALIRIVRAGDKIVIPEAEADAGEYLISEISFSALSASATVVDISGNAVSFAGSSGFNLSIYSGTEVNTFADNNLLVNIPVDLKNWTITSSGNVFSDNLINIIDLRRFVEQSFLEVATTDCVCSNDSCFETADQAPLIKNQKVLPNDLYLPNGDILSAPGVPHHGDFEYVNVILPLPPGSIDNCSINIYESFIKSYNGTCETVAGYPAMKYSDGTLVGCNDSGATTDLSLGKVKISKAISSLHVDALIDGYATDGYTTESSESFAIDNIILNSSYPEVYSSGLSTWPEFESDIYTAININSTYASFEINVDTTSVTNNSTLTRPLAEPDLTGDFTISFTGRRESWDPSKLVLGSIHTYAQVTMDNEYGGTSVLKLGWRQLGDGDGVELFWSGSINDGSVEISSFNFSIPAPDLEGNDVNFRIRRVNDITTAYYYYNKVDSLIINQEYVKIGELLTTNPGEGPANLIFKTESSGAGVSSSYIYKTYIFSDDFIISYDENVSDESAASEILIGNNTAKLNELSFNFPLNLNSKTQVISATIDFTTTQDFNITSTGFKLIPYENINANNLSKYLDLVLSSNSSIIAELIPTSGLAGDTISFDITNAIKSMLLSTGHLPGYYKAFLLTSDAGELDSFYISNSILITVIYYDITTGVIFKVGSTLDPLTGILTLKTKNILYDSANTENRTVLNLGVYLKKAGFKNNDLTVSINDLSRIGLGTCTPAASLSETEECFFVTGSTLSGLFIEGPFPCSFLA
jgi:hypothetical protein